MDFIAYRSLLQNVIHQEQRLSTEDAVCLFENAPLGMLMDAAHQVRNRKAPVGKVSWQIDRNINICNACISGCKFCAFHTGLQPVEGRPLAFTTEFSEYEQKIEELIAKGGDQVLLQGGLHPHYGIEFYEELFRKLKARFPEVKLHALGPPEIAHISRLSGLSYRDVLKRLRKAGLESLPGAGAEILSDRVRKMLSPGKPDVKAWEEVMLEAQSLGFLTSATMMFGHVETIEERMKHLELIRSIQDRKAADVPGFMSFIPWPVALDEKMKAQPVFQGVQSVSASEYVRMIAVSRLFLDNIPNIQASWLTVGRSVAQICLYAGANDLGSIMLEENVLSSAGSSHQMDAQGMQACIREAGFEPWLRDQAFRERKYQI